MEVDYEISEAQRNEEQGETSAFPSPRSSVDWQGEQGTKFLRRAVGIAFPIDLEQDDLDLAAGDSAQVKQEATEEEELP
jgi:hypothetical protein